MPNDVAILGELKENGRRDYGKLWKDLIVAIQGKLERERIKTQTDVCCCAIEDPSAWGYMTSEEHGPFIPSTAGSDVQPFRVHLFGNKAEGFVIPPKLEEHVVVLHRGLDYIDYYGELSSLVSRSPSLPELFLMLDLLD